MQITALQIEQMGRRNFDTRLVGAIRAAYPTQSMNIPTDDFLAMFHRLRPKALAYHLSSEYQLSAFLHAAWLFGEDFDLRIPIVRQILRATDVPPQSKAEALGNFALAVFRFLDNGRSGVMA